MFLPFLYAVYLYFIMLLLKGSLLPCYLVDRGCLFRFLTFCPWENGLAALYFTPSLLEELTLVSTGRCYIYELQLMLDLKGNDVQRLVDRKWLECQQEKKRDRKRTEHEQRGRR